MTIRCISSIILKKNTLRWIKAICDLKFTSKCVSVRICDEDVSIIENSDKEE